MIQVGVYLTVGKFIESYKPEMNREKSRCRLSCTGIFCG